MHRRGEAEHIRVLVVDDETSTRDSLRDMLLDFSYEVATASDGVEAIESYRSFEPDIILLDMNMPRMGGLEFIRHLRDEEGDADVLITMLTSDRTPQNKLTAFGAGANDFLYKPFDRAELLARVGVAARQVRLTSRLRRAFETMDAELAEVASLQGMLLPEREPEAVSWPDVPGLAVSSLYEPSGRASGDYYDYFRLGEGVLRVVVADVSGHGARAAFLMGMVRSLFRVSRRGPMGLADTVALVNEQLCEIIGDQDDFVTLFAADLDLERGEMAYVSAGHCPGLLLAGDAPERLPATATVLGFFRAEYEERRLPLPPHWRLLLFTDGFYDWPMEPGRLFGVEEFLDLAGGIMPGAEGDFPDRLMDALDAVGPGRPAFRDDVTALWIHRDADGKARERVWTRRAGAGNVRPIVKEIIAEAEQYIADESMLLDLSLALTEAVANAALHADPGCGGCEVVIRLSVEPRSKVRLEVRDPGSGFVPDLESLDAPGPDCEAGRGLFIITALMDEVAVASDGGGTVVSFEKSIGGEAWKD